MSAAAFTLCARAASNCKQQVAVVAMICCRLCACAFPFAYHCTSGPERAHKKAAPSDRKRKRRRHCRRCRRHRLNYETSATNGKYAFGSSLFHFTLIVYSLCATGLALLSAIASKPKRLQTKSATTQLLRSITLLAAVAFGSFGLQAASFGFVLIFGAHLIVLQQLSDQSAQLSCTATMTTAAI